MERTQGRNKKLTGFALEKKKRAEDPWIDHGSTLTRKPMKSEDASLFRKVFALHECTLQENNHRLPEDDALTGGERRREEAEEGR